MDLRSRTAIPEVEWFSHEKIGLDGVYVGTKKMSFNENKTENIDSYYQGVKRKELSIWG